MAWQDARLAQQCVARCDVDALDIQQGPGDGHDLIRWYVSASAARVMDDAGVDWRSFVTGECEAPPPAAAPWRTTSRPATAS
jgi:hypothetical protein